MLFSIRSKLIVSFLSVTFLAGSVSLLVGGQLLYRAVLQEATTRVSLDLNAARGIYLSRLKSMTVALSVTTLGEGFRAALASRDSVGLVGRLRRVAEQTDLDFAGIVTRDGGTLCRIGPDSLARGPADAANPLATTVLARGEAVSGTVVLSQEFLRAEDPLLAERARIALVATPRAAPRSESEETAGMALAAAVPLEAAGKLIGVLYGGILLNRSEDVVDAIRGTVFQDEVHEGRGIGTATIFLKDLRIATNVVGADGRRAIGTRVSREVRDRVLEQGGRWSDRAFVVSDWYITAYEPILDVFGERVGMLYVGVLEAKYAAVRHRAVAVLVGLTVAGMGLAVWLGYSLASRIVRPIERLVTASVQVSSGILAPRLSPPSGGELGVLERTFADMISSLQERERRLQAESEVRLLQSEKQASIGRLAAGVAHEINNPLTGVLTYTHMLLRRTDLGEEVRADLGIIARETDRVRRIVRGLLDFARETRLQEELTDISELVRSTVSLMANQALIGGVRLERRLSVGLPSRPLDRSQVQSALLNLILNALDATEPGGVVTVSTGLGAAVDESEQPGLEITVIDTGCGIAPQNLPRLFDPFFTTKEPGRGTGLGLSVSLGIVQRHGGTVRVDSEVGRGSTFTIWLPVRA